MGCRAPQLSKAFRVVTECCQRLIKIGSQSILMKFLYNSSKGSFMRFLLSKVLRGFRGVLVGLGVRIHLDRQRPPSNLFQSLCRFHQGSRASGIKGLQISASG